MITHARRPLASIAPLALTLTLALGIATAPPARGSTST